MALGSYVGVIQGLYRDNGKENGNYYLALRVWGLGLGFFGFKLGLL